MPAILARKGGEFPPFWDKDSAFIAVLEELYLRVREKHKGVLSPRVRLPVSTAQWQIRKSRKPCRRPSTPG